MNIADFEAILYEKEENGICTITINRPERRNAVTYVTFLEILTVLEDMEKDKNTKVLLITGNPEGNAFSSGGYFEPNYFEKIQKEIRMEIDLMDIAQKKLCMALWKFSKPVIAAINGLYFSKRAIIPEFSASFMLPFLVGFQKAKEICFFGDKITAQKAFELGLVNKVLPKEELIPFARQQALRLIPPQGPYLSIKLMKKTMHAYFIDILDKTLDLENKGLRKLFRSKDFNESMRALKEKRDPIFIGR